MQDLGFKPRLPQKKNPSPSTQSRVVSVLTKPLKRRYKRNVDTSFSPLINKLGI